MDLKSFLIKKGNHRSGFYPNIHFGLKNLKYQVLFTDSCLYKFNDVDDFDINKLFGISFGFHHKNSARFGWNVEEGQIAIYAYCYKLGIRYSRRIAIIPINKIFIFEINTYDVYFEFKITNYDGKIISLANIAKAKCCKWGYKLFPYFGGNKTAPHTMTIKMKEFN